MTITIYLWVLGVGDELDLGGQLKYKTLCKQLQIKFNLLNRDRRISKKLHSVSVRSVDKKPQSSVIFYSTPLLINGLHRIFIKTFTDTFSHGIAKKSFKYYVFLHALLRVSLKNHVLGLHKNLFLIHGLYNFYV